MLTQILLPRFDCATCKEYQKRERGCENEPLVPEEIDGQTLTRCPLRPYLESPASYNEVLDIYSWYKKGHFPDTGSYLDQAAAFVEVVTIIDKAVEDGKTLKEKAERGKGKK